MIDTHSHIYLPEFDADREDVIRHSKQNGVTHIILPNVDLETVGMVHDTYSLYPGYTSMAMGLHPTSVDDNYKETLDKIFALFSGNNYIAVGEIGIDLYWDKKYRKQQHTVFQEQLKIANTLNLPVIIHCREGLDDILGIFENFHDTLPKCVFHSFTGTKDEIKAIRRYGDFYFGINGIITFKNASISNILEDIGPDRILLETDSPYLAPVPNRGKRNESSFLYNISEYISNILGLSQNEISEITDKNARNLFKIE